MSPFRMGGPLKILTFESFGVCNKGLLSGSICRSACSTFSRTALHAVIKICFASKEVAALTVMCTSSHRGCGTRYDAKLDNLLSLIWDDNMFPSVCDSLLMTKVYMFAIFSYATPFRTDTEMKINLICEKKNLVLYYKWHPTKMTSSKSKRL